MQADLRETLRAQAPVPRRPLDLRAVRERAHSLTRRRWQLMAGGAVIVLGGGSALATQIDVFDSRGPGVPWSGEEGLDCPVPQGYESDVVVYLRSDPREGEIAELYERVNALDGVEAVYYITSEEALREFKDTFREEPHLWETLGPRSLPESLRVVLRDPEEAERIGRMIKEWKGAVDDVRWGRLTDEEVQELFERNENGLPPSICPQATTPDRTSGTEGDFTSEFITEPVTFSGQVEGIPWSLSVRTAESNDGEVGFCSDLSYGPGLNTGMDCVYNSPSVLDERGKPAIDLIGDVTGREHGHPYAFLGTVPGDSATVELVPEDTAVQEIEVFDVQEDLEIPVKVVVGFSTTRDAILRAYDEDGNLLAERELS